MIEIKFNEKNLTLEIYRGKGLNQIHYYIDLERCNTSAEILDWIAQVAEKLSYSNEDIGKIVRSLHKILNFQKYFCGNGMEMNRSNYNNWSKSVLRSEKLNIRRRFYEYQEEEGGY